MNKFEIRCTEAQTRKALELGAPIARQSPNTDAPFFSHGTEHNELGQKVSKLWSCPTAEEMVGWLEEQELFIYIDKTNDGCFYLYDIFDNEQEFISGCGNKRHSSRPEATLAAIDAALEYLTNNKK